MQITTTSNLQATDILCLELSLVAIFFSIIILIFLIEGLVIWVSRRSDFKKYDLIIVTKDTEEIKKGSYGIINTQLNATTYSIQLLDEKTGMRLTNIPAKVIRKI